MDSSISRARFAVTIFLIVTNDPHYEVLMSAVKTDQSEGIPGAGIPEQAVKKMLTCSAALSLPSPFAFFRALFLNSRFPHYLGALNRLVQLPSVGSRAIISSYLVPLCMQWDRKRHHVEFFDLQYAIRFVPLAVCRTFWRPGCWCRTRAIVSASNEALFAKLFVCKDDTIECQGKQIPWFSY